MPIFARPERGPGSPIPATTPSDHPVGGVHLQETANRHHVCADCADADNFRPMKFVLPSLALSVLSILAFAQENTTPPPRVYPVALPNYDEETATRLQIFLDNSDFGPGKIDGKMGEFFRKALISFKHAHAM